MASWHLRGVGELAPVVPAPMSGYGDRAWRELARRMGCQLLVVPIVSAEGLARDDVKTKALLDIEDEPPPLAVQLFGARAEALAEAARRVEALGVQAVDLNLGCPARRVVQGNGGAALLKHPARIGEIVRAMRRAVSIPLTAKIRAGWDETTAPAVELARLIEAEGADALAIHARTGRQQFKGAADWRAIAAVKAAVSIPVLGNGDVRTGEDAWRMRAETGCDAVMIGRSAIGNPWLWRDALAWLESGAAPAEPPPPPTVFERLDVLVEHARLMAHYRGEPHGVIEFRKHAVHYLRGIRNARPLKQLLISATTVLEVEQAVGAFRSSL